MALFPYKRVKVTEGLYIKQSQYFYYTEFGVRDFEERRYTGSRYVNTGTPGTGFIERDVESHGYHNFVRSFTNKQQPNYWRLLTGRQPSYAKEVERARQALSEAEEPMRRRILEAYVNALGVGRTEEQLERVVQGIKDKIGNHSNKFLVSVLSHYKSKIKMLERDMRSVEIHVQDLCTPEQYEAYKEVTEAFSKVTENRRVWHYNEDAKHKYVQVYFDMGIFDFIRSENYLPVMRDSKGREFYLLPTHLVVAKSNVDFECVPLKGLTIVGQELSIEEPVEVISQRLGDVTSMIRIPEYDVTWYFNHVKPVMRLMGAIEELKNRL